MEQKQYIIGVDPGKNGGITVLYGNKVISVTKMPSSPSELYDYFLYLGLPKNYRGELTIIIEDVHSMPTDSSKGAFTFGRGLGQLEGVIAAMGLTGALKRISPMKWMNHFGMKRDKAAETKIQFKNRLKDLAILKSNQKLTLATCDSYLIALYQKEHKDAETNK